MKLNNKTLAISLFLLALILSVGRFGEAKSGDQRVPNPNLADGLAHWTVYGDPRGSARVVPLSADIAPTAVELDSRLSAPGTEMGIQSDAFPVLPLKVYRMGGMVKRIYGGDSYKITIEWLDKNHVHLAYVNGWNGLLVGQKWEPHQIRVIAPEGAVFGRIIGGISVGNKCLMTNFELTEINSIGPDLAVDLLADTSTLTVRIENRGDVKAEGIWTTITLPAGLRSSGPLSYGAGNLSFGQSYRTVLPLSGTPSDPIAPICFVASARVNGQGRAWSKTTKPFITTAHRQVMASSDLTTPTLPTGMGVKLGAYYFPSMMDWKHGGSGVRYVDYLKPELGYYNDALPEVADWHIQWAATHGISFFAFDWYHNQGYDYINDALDKGFLQSRFAGKMEFCIHWCNSSITDFKPFNGSDEALEDVARVLCERYFSKPNYLKVDGKPVLILFSPHDLVNARGTWADGKKGLDRMRAIARKYGHPDLYIVAAQNNPYLCDYKLGGYDCATAYSFMYCDVPFAADRSASYEALLPQYREGWAIARERAHAQAMDYIPSAWAGWDNISRVGTNATRTRGNTPAAFRRMIEALPEFTEPQTKLALIEAWNEWGEGTILEPGKPYDFGRLNAVRDIFTNQRGPHSLPVPTATDYARMQYNLTDDEMNQNYYLRYARQLGLENGFQMDFNSPASLWMRADGDMRYVRIKDGALRGESVGVAPGLVGPSLLNLIAGKVYQLRLRMSVSAGSSASLRWTTKASPVWSDSCLISFPILGDGQMHEYVIDLRKNPKWTGVIRQLKLTPTNAAASIAIDDFRSDYVNLGVTEPHTKNGKNPKEHGTKRRKGSVNRPCLR